MRPRLVPVPALLSCAALAACPTASVAAAPSPSAPSASAASAKPKKKRTTSQRVTALSRSLNRAKAQGRSTQKQLDALVRQQSQLSDQVTAATTKVTDSVKVSTPESIVALLQDPSTGLPALLGKFADDTTRSVRQLLSSTEYAVAVVTVGGVVASPTLLVSPDIPDYGAPVTFSGKVSVVVPPGASDAPIDVRIGAVSQESDGNGPSDPAFVASLGHLSVEPKGYTGDLGDAILRGGADGVNLTQTRDGSASLCRAGGTGCGAPVSSAGNPDLGLLPFWPVGDKVVSFGDRPGVSLELDKTLSLAAAGRLSSVTGGTTRPITVTTPARAGLAMLEADVTITVMDPSVNPADPFA